MSGPGLLLVRPGRRLAIQPEGRVIPTPGGGPVPAIGIATFYAMFYSCKGLRVNVGVGVDVG